MPIVYSYRAKVREQDRPLIIGQLRAAHRYRNRLCEIELTRRQQVDAALREVCPRLLEVEAELAALDGELTAEYERVKKANVQERARKRPAPEQQQRIAAIKTELKSLRAERKALRTGLFGMSERVDKLRKAAADLHGKPAETVATMQGLLWEEGCDGLRAALAARLTAEAGQKRAQDDAIREELAKLVEQESNTPAAARRLAEIDTAAKQAAKDARHQSGLYWGTYLTVEEAAASFRTGAPPRFKRWEGRGLLGVQFVGGLLVEDALRGATKFTIRDGAKPKWRELQMRIGQQEDECATLDVIYDRPLPEDATIKWAKLAYRKVASQDHFYINFILDRPGGFPRDDRATEGTAAVDIGWRRLDDGSIRVAYWMGSDGEEGSLEIPAGQAQRLPRCDTLNSVRSLLFDGARSVLARWRKIEQERDSEPPEWLRGQSLWCKFEIQGAPAGRQDQLRRWLTHFQGLCAAWSDIPAMPEWLQTLTDHAHAWKSHGKLAQVVYEWRNQRFAGDDHLYGVFEAWRQQDKHLWEWTAHNRQRYLNWRLDCYRVFARMLARRYRTLVIEDVDWRAFSVKPTADEADEMKLARARKHVTAPSLLENCLRYAFGAADTKDLPAKNMTATCAVCGELCGETDRWKLVLECSQCRSSFDQDRNACRNLLRAAGCDEKSASLSQG